MTKTVIQNEEVTKEIGRGINCQEMRKRQLSRRVKEKRMAVQKAQEARVEESGAGGRIKKGTATAGKLEEADLNGKDDGDRRRVVFRIININGLTMSKYVDIEENFFRKEEVNIVCLTETHKRVEDIYISSKINTFNVMRKKKDKKGGGIQVLLPNMSEIVLEKKENSNRDMLELEGKIHGMRMKMVVVYFDANKDEGGRSRSRKLRSDIERIMENNKMEGLMIMGDFNGHLKMIDGKDDDENGKMILEWIEKYKLIMLNLEDRCEGIYTRIRGEQKTTIDYVLVNDRVYEDFRHMHIDEEKEIIDGSDHTLITVDLEVQKSMGKNKTRWKEVIYYSDKEEVIRECVQELGEIWEGDGSVNLQGRIDKILEIAELRMKRKRRIKVEGEMSNIPVENKWMTEEIRRGIKKRQSLNRRKRNGKTSEEVLRFTRGYKNQKYRVQKLIRDAMREYEIKLAKEIRGSSNRGKDTWRLIDKLSGRDRKEKNVLEVYENGENVGRAETKRRLTEVWGEQFKSQNKELTPLHSGEWRRERIEEIENLYEKKNKEATEVGGKVWILQQKPVFEEEHWNQELNKLRKKKRQARLS